MTSEQFSKISNTLPLEPGIYKYYNESGTLIYVGKAKFLRKRISSYFQRNLTHQKTIELVKNIHRIEFTIVDNEEDALFLENNLIKEYQPHYNINLKDDKTYPYVVVKNEHFPRVFFSRKKIKDGSFLFGPYTSVVNAREIIDFVKQYFPLRNCTLNLNPRNISQKKFKVCLEYHLGNCKGPCEGFQTKEDYDEGIERLKEMLRGNLTPIMQHFKQEMKKCADALDFEKAESYHRKIENLKQYKVRSSVVDTRTGTLDVFSLIETDEDAVINYLSVNEGSIIHTKTITLEKIMDETKEEILQLAITELRTLFNSSAKEIILPFAINHPDQSIIITVPKAGDKRKLLDLSIKNAEYCANQNKAKKLLLLESADEKELKYILLQLKEDLKLSVIPEHIECFDNSNIQGTNPVAAMVCFKNGKPSKNDYRKFNIKTVEGINDFASMKEIVFRRYKRISDAGEKMPSLIIIDGGKGQLNAAMESIRELKLDQSTTVVGLAKNKEEIFFPGDSQSILLPWNSDSLKLIRKIRDEVHRFGISFHRQQRSRSALENELESIPGIGKSTADILLKSFKSVKKIKQIDMEALSAVVGEHKAKLIYQHFNEV